jgi:hypothetical protein
MIDLLYVRVGILLICGNHLDDRYQVKSAPGHFGTYLHSQIGTSIFKRNTSNVNHAACEMYLIYIISIYLMKEIIKID